MIWLVIVAALAAGYALGRAHMRRTLTRLLLEHVDLYGANLIAPRSYRKEPTP